MSERDVYCASAFFPSFENVFLHNDSFGNLGWASLIALVTISLIIIFQENRKKAHADLIYGLTRAQIISCCACFGVVSLMSFPGAESRIGRWAVWHEGVMVAYFQLLVAILTILIIVSVTSWRFQHPPRL